MPEFAVNIVEHAKTVALFRAISIPGTATSLALLGLL